MNATLNLPFDPRSDKSGSVRAFALAAVVHAALFTFLYFGISWQSKPVGAVVDELWAPLPPMSAPPPRIETPPEPPKPVLKPVVEEEPPAPPPVKAVIEQKVEKKPPPKVEKKEPQKKEPPPKKEVVKPEIKPAPVDDLRRALMNEEMSKMAQREDIAAKAMKESSASGQRASKEWQARVASLIRNKVPFPIANAVQGNPTATFEVTLLPGLEIGLVRLIRSSGNAQYDEAAARAIQAISPLPPPPGGMQLGRTFTLNARPKDE